MNEPLIARIEAYLNTLLPPGAEECIAPTKLLREALAALKEMGERNRELVEACKEMLDAAPHTGEGAQRALACLKARTAIERDLEDSER